MAKPLCTAVNVRPIKRLGEEYRSFTDFKFLTLPLSRENPLTKPQSQAHLNEGSVCVWARLLTVAGQQIGLSP